MTQPPSTTFLTGATGFLGHYVLRDLLLRGRRVVAMLRPPLPASARRLRDMALKIGIETSEYIDRGQLVYCEGALPDALPTGHPWGATIDLVSCAASLQLFSNGNGEPYHTNVTGVEALIDWARGAGVRTIHAVSTAYVCGAYKDNVREVFHPEPPSFQTEYERSKWIAEGKLAEWGREEGNTLTVLRPSFLIGDTTTGYTTQFGGFYQFARLVALMAEHYRDGSNGNGTYISHRIPGAKNDPVQNLVPVDHASRLVAEIVLDPTLHGRIYHLTDPAPPTWDDFKRWLEDYFHVCGGFYVDELPPDHNPAETLLWEKYDLLMPRIHHHVQFDNCNARQVMERGKFCFPKLTHERFTLLLDYAASQRWGQKNGRDHNGSHRAASRLRRAKVH
jgi:nucleoside-diphosphate-sugar epimerase